MKKYNPASLYIVILCLSTLVSFYIPKPGSASASEETVIIPEEAIRLRILANSDSEKDQSVKRAIRDEVNEHITGWVKDLTSMDAAREVISSHLPDIQSIAERYVEEQGLEQEVTIKFGPAQFPTKLYGQYLYPAGEYEAIVITLGEGKGANWWCVLFPPLCFLDFSNGTAVSQTPMEDEEEQEEQLLQDEEEQIGEVGKQEEDPLYVEDDEKTEVIEKKLFVVEMFNSLF